MQLNKINIMYRGCFYRKTCLAAVTFLSVIQVSCSQLQGRFSAKDNESNGNVGLQNEQHKKLAEELAEKFKHTNKLENNRENMHDTLGANSNRNSKYRTDLDKEIREILDGFDDFLDKVLDKVLDEERDKKRDKEIKTDESLKSPEAPKEILDHETKAKEGRKCCTIV